MAEYHTTCKTTEQDTHTSRQTKQLRNEEDTTRDKRRTYEHENYEHHPQDNIRKSNEKLTNRPQIFYTFLFPIPKTTK